MFNIKEYFNYSKQEVRGVLVLLILILLVFILPLIVETFYSKDNLDTSVLKDVELKTINLQKKEQLIIYTNFNPNTVSYSELLKLGLSEKQAKTFINYRKSGGVFKKPKDLKKVYSIDDKLYSKIEPYIVIPHESNKKNSIVKKQKIKPKKTYSHIEDKKIELNGAEIPDLIKLYGIGDVLSKRVIKYRDKLGGFVKPEQLLEVYGVNKEIYNRIKYNIVVDTSKINKIDINKATFKEINAHPYISYVDTKRILKYRKIIGKFNNTKELIDNKLVEDSTYNKLRPYLK
jgi:DNA uptake protein ComE-like DNA-binding protein